MHLWKNEILTSATSEGEPIAECLTAPPHTLRTSPVMVVLGLNQPAKTFPANQYVANLGMEFPLTERHSNYEASVRRCTNEPTRLQHPVLRNSGNARRVCLLPYPNEQRC